MLSISTRVRSYDAILICQKIFYLSNLAAWLARRKHGESDDEGPLAVLLLFNFGALLTTLFILGSPRPPGCPQCFKFALGIGPDYHTALELSAIMQGFNVPALILFTIYTAPYLTSPGLAFFTVCWSCLSLAGISCCLSFSVGDGDQWPLPPSLLSEELESMPQYTDEEEPLIEGNDDDDGPLWRAYTMQVEESEEPEIPSISVPPSSFGPVDSGELATSSKTLMRPSRAHETSGESSKSSIPSPDVRQDDDLHNTSSPNLRQNHLVSPEDVEPEGEWEDTDALLQPNSPRAYLRTDFLQDGMGFVQRDGFLRVFMPMTTVVVGFMVPILMLVLTHTHVTFWPDWVAGLYFIPPCTFLLRWYLLHAYYQNVQSSGYRWAAKMAWLVFLLCWGVAAASCLSVPLFFESKDHVINPITVVMSGIVFMGLYAAVALAMFATAVMDA